MSFSFFGWRDSLGQLQEFEKETGETGKEHPIHGLPQTIATAIVATATNTASVVTALTSVQTYVDGLEALIGATNTAIATLQGYTDGLEALITTSNGFTDGLETLITATNSALTTLHGYVDGVEAKLDTLHTDLTAGTPYIEQIIAIPALAGSPSSFASHAFAKGQSCYVRNCSTGGQLQYVTVSGATPTADNGWILAPGECTPPVDAGNASIFKLLGSASGGAAAVLGS